MNGFFVNELLSISELTFSYGTKQVFNEFNFELNYPITGIVGVNGAGKSTLTKLITGILIPQKGEILVAGKNVVTERMKALRNIGVLHENPVFPPWAKVLEYLLFVGELRGLGKEKALEQALFFLKKLEILDRRDDYVSQLSAGLRQRFGLAQALIGFPKLIILDEPTANLDVKSRLQVLSMLSELSRKFRINIIIFSHIFSELEKVCDAIAILHEGKILYHEPISKLFSETRNLCYVLRGPKNRILGLIETIENDEQLKKRIVSIDQENTISHLSQNEDAYIEVRIYFDNKTKIEEIREFQSSLPDNVSFRPEKTPLENLFFRITGISEKN